MALDSSPELVIVTNTPTPYRISFFNSLQNALENRGARLRVLYCALREPHRHWDLQLDSQNYPWTIMAGLHPTLRGWHAHINISVIRHLRLGRPTWIMSAGAWNLPTVLLAAQPLIAGEACRIFWSEGHARAVLHPHGPIAVVRRRALRSYSAFAVPNEASARFVRREAGAKARVILLPNTVDDEFFSSPSTVDRALSRQKLGLSPSTSLLVSIAQLEDRKGVTELVSGYERLAPELRDTTVLAIIGSGSLKAVLEARAQALTCGEIRLPGHLDQMKIRDWLWAADAFVLASKLDPNPLSPIEAAFCGLPLLLSRQAGNVDELVHEGVNGFVIEEHDAVSVAAILRQFLLLDQTARQRMGEASSEIANRAFRRRNVAERFARELIPDQRR